MESWEWTELPNSANSAQDSAESISKFRTYWWTTHVSPRHTSQGRITRRPIKAHKICHNQSQGRSKSWTELADSLYKSCVWLMWAESTCKSQTYWWNSHVSRGVQSQLSMDWISVFIHKIFFLLVTDNPKSARPNCHSTAQWQFVLTCIPWTVASCGPGRGANKRLPPTWRLRRSVSPGSVSWGTS